MAEPEAVTHLPRPLPDKVEIDKGMTLTPNEMRALRDATGRTLTDLLGGSSEAGELDDSPDQVQALLWTVLRRQGFDPTWDQAGDVFPRYREPEAPDPSSAGG